MTSPNRGCSFRTRTSAIRSSACPCASAAGGQEGGRPKPVVLHHPAAQISDRAAGDLSGGGSASAGRSTRDRLPPPSCSTPGWFGCPEQPQDYSGIIQGQQPAGNGSGAAPNGQIFGQQPPPPQKKCPIGPGWFGCQEQPQDYSQPPAPGSAGAGTAHAQADSGDQEGPVPPGQVFGQPRASPQKNCMLNGWFGCQEQ